MNGRLLGHEWVGLKSGDEVTMGPWKFRFEVSAKEEDTSSSS
ncbi:MAG: hypothetical protein AAF517_08310 [Planctomycetota bacterium]